MISPGVSGTPALNCMAVCPITIAAMRASMMFRVPDMR